MQLVSERCPISIDTGGSPEPNPVLEGAMYGMVPRLVDTAHDPGTIKFDVNFDTDALRHPH